MFFAAFVTLRNIMAFTISMVVLRTSGTDCNYWPLLRFSGDFLVKEVLHTVYTSVVGVIHKFHRDNGYLFLGVKICHPKDVDGAIFHAF